MPCNQSASASCSDPPPIMLDKMAMMSREAVWKKALPQMFDFVLLSSKGALVAKRTFRLERNACVLIKADLSYG